MGQVKKNTQKLGHNGLDLLVSLATACILVYVNLNS